MRASPSREWLQVAQNEAYILARLPCEFIIRYIDSYTKPNDYFYLILEYAKCGSLLDRIVVFLSLLLLFPPSIQFIILYRNTNPKTDVFLRILSSDILYKSRVG